MDSSKVFKISMGNGLNREILYSYEVLAVFSKSLLSFLTASSGLSPAAECFSISTNAALRFLDAFS